MQSFPGNTAERTLKDLVDITMTFGNGSVWVVEYDCGFQHVPVNPCLELQ
jgi:hypothetical protein